MATNVTQVIPVEPSIQGNADYNFFTEYQIPGQSVYLTTGTTTYILDSNASLVYVYTNGQLGSTNGNYTAFQAFLVLNPVTATVSPVSTPTGPIPNPFPPYVSPTLPTPPQTVAAQETNDLLSEMVTIMRSMHLAVVSLATQGGLAEDTDFSLNSIDFDSINLSRSYQ